MAIKTAAMELTQVTNNKADKKRISHNKELSANPDKLNREAKSTPEKDLAYYLGLPYSYEFIPDEDGVWFAAVRELPGCMTESDNLQDAYAMIRDAMTVWIGMSLELGHEVPEPFIQRKYSGKFNVRVSKDLHKQVSEAAESENVSLNQFVNVALAKAVAPPRS